MKFVNQRRKKMQMAAVPSRNQSGLGITRGASPNSWTAPMDAMSGSDPIRSDSKSGDANYGPTETRRRYNSVTKV